MFKKLSGFTSLLSGVVTFFSYSINRDNFILLLVFILSILAFIISFIVDEAIKEHERRYHDVVSRVKESYEFKTKIDNCLITFNLSKQGLLIINEDDKEIRIKLTNLLINIDESDKGKFILIKDYINKSINYKLKYDSEELASFYNKYKSFKGY